MKSLKTGVFLLPAILSAVLLFLVSCDSGSGGSSPAPGSAVWAKSVSEGENDSSFNSVTTDSSGNMYAVGVIRGTGTYTFPDGSTGQSVNGTSNNNAVIVKYDSNGNALWAKSVSAGNASSSFKGVTTDTSGNIYAAGYIEGTGTYTFPDGSTGQSVNGASSNSNPVIVKYDSNGNALWVKSVSAGNSYSPFYSVTTDSSGNIYAAGYITGTETYTFPDGSTGQSVNGTHSNNNAVIVKYDSNGNALWAKSVSAGAGNSQFKSVTTDTSGNIYAAGYIYGSGTFTFPDDSTGQSVNGADTGYNAVIVKYDSSGNALWAKSVSAGSSYSEFFSVTTDSSGNIYAAGYIFGTGTFTFPDDSTGQSVNGAYTGYNAVIVKYDSSGNALWAKSVSAGNSSSQFKSITTDPSGNIYAAGYINKTGTYTFPDSDSGQSVNGASSVDNVVIVKYAGNGHALWVRSLSAGISSAGYSSVTTDSSGNVYSTGYILGTGTFTFPDDSTGQSVNGTYSSENAVIVRYQQ